MIRNHIGEQNFRKSLKVYRKITEYIWLIHLTYSKYLKKSQVEKWHHFLINGFTEKVILNWKLNTLTRNNLIEKDSINSQKLKIKTLQKNNYEKL